MCQGAFAAVPVDRSHVAARMAQRVSSQRPHGSRLGAREVNDETGSCMSVDRERTRSQTTLLPGTVATRWAARAARGRPIILETQ